MNIKKNKLLLILHRSPPMHGAAKVGDFISSSEELSKEFDCKFITIKSSDTISDIGKISFKKIYLLVELFLKVLWVLLIFRPDKIYFTASIRSVAFYRDLVISSLWKIYKCFKSVDIYYHYHTKGVDEFVSASRRNLKLTSFFVRNVNLILLTPLLEQDFVKVKSYKKIYFLPNGVSDPFEYDNFDLFLDSKYKENKPVSVLYLSNMIKSKGYFEVLKLANVYKESDLFFHFAGAWENDENKNEFFTYIKENNLSGKVIYHGFVNGVEKDLLFKQVDILMFPTRYKAESFGLVITEAMSYGIPIIATDEGSISYILDGRCGCVINNIESLSQAFEMVKMRFLNKETSIYCRKRYLDYFSLEKFEYNLIEILCK